MKISVGVTGVEVGVTLTPSEARRYARDLRQAAVQAEQGDAELTAE